MSEVNDSLFQNWSFAPPGESPQADIASAVKSVLRSMTVNGHPIDVQGSDIAFQQPKARQEPAVEVIHFPDTQTVQHAAPSHMRGTSLDQPAHDQVFSSSAFSARDSKEKRHVLQGAMRDVSRELHSARKRGDKSTIHHLERQHKELGKSLQHLLRHPNAPQALNRGPEDYILIPGLFTGRDGTPYYSTFVALSSDDNSSYSSAGGFSDTAALFGPGPWVGYSEDGTPGAPPWNLWFGACDASFVNADLGTDAIQAFQFEVDNDGTG